MKEVVINQFNLFFVSVRDENYIIMNIEYLHPFRSLPAYFIVNYLTLEK